MTRTFPAFSTTCIVPSRQHVLVRSLNPTRPLRPLRSSPRCHPLITLRADNTTQSSQNDPGESAQKRSVRPDINSTASQTFNNRNYNKKDNFHSPQLSRTLFGRVFVEVLSLLLGALLLFIMLLWRLSQFIAIQIVRVLTRLSGIRHFSKWSASRLARIKTISVPVPSLSHAVRRLLIRTRRNSTTTSNFKPAVDVTHHSIPSEHNSSSNSDGHNPVHGASPDNFAKPRDRSHAVHGRRLIVLRHAKTHWDRQGDTPDHERSLSPKGCEEARLIGDEIARAQWYPDFILCSDAARTMQTLQLLQLPQSPDVKTVWTNSLYYAVTADEMTVAVDEALSTFPPNATVLIVAHNPGCEELIELLTGDRAEMGTACAALLKCKDIPWNSTESKSEPAKIVNESFSLSSERFKWSLVDLIRPPLSSQVGS